MSEDPHRDEPVDAPEHAEELGIDERIWWATKVNVAGRGGTPADPAAALAQIERSFDRLRIPVIDLIQVHNMGDPPTQLGVLERCKAAGRVRYSGITTTNDGQYAALANVMRNEPIDFIGIDYAVDNRTPEEVILPLAQERNIGVLVYLPFGRNRLWGRIGDRPVPDWAAEFDAHTWAQFMLKFVIANPAVTVATPGLDTWTAAAWFAITAASDIDAPSANASETTAVTVSPAPETSKTARSNAGKSVVPFPVEHNTIPCLPRVRRR